jgi:hypothetical protein
MALVRERPPLVGEVVTNLRIEGVAWSAQRIPTVVNLGFLDRSPYFFFQVAPQLSSQGWVDPVSDPLLLKNLQALRIEPRTTGSVARNSYHYTKREEGHFYVTACLSYAVMLTKPNFCKLQNSTYCEISRRRTDLENDFLCILTSSSRSCNQSWSPSLSCATNHRPIHVSI